MIKGWTAAFFNLHRRESLSLSLSLHGGVSSSVVVEGETDKDGLFGSCAS